MQFLDAIGLASFWEKIKSWVGKNYLSLKGGTVHGDVEIDNGGLTVSTENGINLREHDTSPRNVSLSFIDGLVFSQAIGDGNDYSENAHYDSSEAKTGKFVKNGGTATQVLMADGSVRTLNTSNGIAGLDANGNVPLANLGNLDTTVAEVVTALPTSNIKRHIYLVKDSDTTNNKYAEYVYTGDISAAYDSTKWEKLGDFRADVDLKDYSKKSDTVKNIFLELDGDSKSGYKQILSIEYANSTSKTIKIENATGTLDGFMSASDKNKLDRIAPNANNYSLPLAANGTRGGIQVGYEANGRNYPVQLSGEKAYVNVPWTDTNTTYDLSPYAKTVDVNAALSKKVDVVSGKGLSTNDFTAAYKSKLDKIKLDANSVDLDDVCTFTFGYPNVVNNPEDVTINFKSVNKEDYEITIYEAETNAAGVMSAADKTKLDGISSGATADSAIPTSVIDALN